MAGPDFVLVALADAHGRLLHQERDEHAPVAPELWTLPGGGVEPGETAHAAAVRELAEETGLTGVDLTDLGTFHFFFREADTWSRFGLFVATSDLTEADVECHEGRRMVFLDPSEAGRLPHTTASVVALPHVLASSPYVAAHGRRPGRGFAGVLLVDSRGWLLLQERDEHPVIDPDRWGLPGGHLEPHEEPLAGALRELAEETAVVLRPDDVVPAGTFVVYHAGYDSLDTMHVFAGSVDLADDDVECHEGRRIVFVAPERALRLDLTAAAQQVVPGFLASDLCSSMAT